MFSVANRQELWALDILNALSGFNVGNNLFNCINVNILDLK